MKNSGNETRGCAMGLSGKHGYVFYCVGLESLCFIIHCKLFGYAFMRNAPISL